MPADTDAVRLLRHRAAALDVSLDGAEDLVAAARLCRWLEGVPLAVELVAGQLVDRGIGVGPAAQEWEPGPTDADPTGTDGGRQVAHPLPRYHPGLGSPA
ncbi:hypothetical protein ACFW5I_14340 [Streptomyces sp. NPDC058818]|uniref:hypothetical protein n=1 Tax=Streptomyces sp. NPDC058818 TaxID=3346640 RepID=UPI0036B1CBE6